MRFLRKYIRQLLLEDAFDFAKEAGMLQRAGDMQKEREMGRPVDRSSRRKIKDLFRKHADHQWLSTLVTVHWVGDQENLEDLIGRGKDELSTSMTLPGDQLKWSDYGSAGLWVKGRITLATNDMDDLHSGHQGDYKPAPSDHWSYRENPTEEEYEHQKKSSGINKQPKAIQKYSQYAKIPDTEKSRDIFKKTHLSKFPYILDEDTWEEPGNYPNEALVDNWKPMAIVLVDEDTIERDRKILASEKDQDGYPYASKDRLLSMGIYKIAAKFNVPVVDSNLEPIWTPGD
jgi:hypothetical protein